MEWFMKVRAVDIARILNLSKATVSLALNGKPGVSEQTRKNIMECKAMLEEGLERGLSVQDIAGGLSEESGARPASEESSIPPDRMQIKILLISKGLRNVQGAEMDLWTDVNAVFERMVGAMGYELGIMYLDLRQKEDRIRMVRECSVDRVAGVIVLGTELHKEDASALYAIRKPIVIYDSDLEDPRYPCVMINNRQGIEKAVSYLAAHGKKDITYLCNALPMYNYESRRRGFEEAVRGDRGAAGLTGHIVPAGESIEEVYLFMRTYLDRHEVTDAFLMDSYQVTIGTIRALREKGIHVPEDISLIGVDLLPSYLTGDCHLTTVRIPHTERAYWVVQMLKKEIEDPVSEKSRIYTDCELIEGETVS